MHMKAMILAGGQGRRLRPLTDTLPKPMVPVMNRPAITYLIRLLKQHGITEIGIALGYRGHMIEEYCGDGRRFGVHVSYFREETPLGTAGCLRSANSFLDEDFIVLSGDAVTDIDLTAALHFHQEKDALATLVLSETEQPLDYGVIVTDPDGRIRHIAEKPDWDEVRSDRVNTGIYLLKPRVLSCIPPDAACDFARDLFPRLLTQNERLYGYVSRDYWCDIGDMAAYRRCHQDIFRGRIDLGIPRETLQSGVLIGENCRIAKDAVIERFTVVGDHSVIGARASVRDSILWAHSQIPENADLYRSICFGRQVAEPPQADSALPRAEHNRFSGTINEDITPEFLLRLAMAFADALPEDAKMLISLSDNSQYMMLKFALLSGLIAGGAEAYNLVGGGDRSMACFALRRLALSGGIHVHINGQSITLELLDKNGIPADHRLMKAVSARLASGDFRRAPLTDFKAPVNITRIPPEYFRDLVISTPVKRLNFHVAVCTQTAETRDHLKKIGAAFGLSLLFTNKPELLPELIQKNKLHFGLLIGENGKFSLLDEHGHVIDGDRFYGLVTLIVSSAVQDATLLLPQHSSTLTEAVAEACGGSVRRMPEAGLEAALLADGSAAARLQHDLCFDPLRCLIRICEFLYLNRCTLSYVCHLFPVMHKISRAADCPPEKKGYVMRKILTELGTGKSVDFTDGIKITDDRGWVLIMPDCQKQSIHIVTESTREEFADDLAGSVCQKIREWTGAPPAQA